MALEIVDGSDRTKEGALAFVDAHSDYHEEDEDVHKKAVAEGRVLTAWMGIDRPVGYLRWIESDDEQTIVLDTVMVSKSYRHIGVATALVKRLLTNLQQPTADKQPKNLLIPTTIRKPS